MTIGHAPNTRRAIPASTRARIRAAASSAAHADRVEATLERLVDLADAHTGDIPHTTAAIAAHLGLTRYTWTAYARVLTVAGALDDLSDPAAPGTPLAWRLRHVDELIAASA